MSSVALEGAFKVWKNNPGHSISCIHSVLPLHRQSALCVMLASHTALWHTDQKEKNTAFVGSLIYSSGGQTQVDPWAVKEITQQADLHVATDAKKEATPLIVAHSEEPWLLMGKESTGGCITITYTSQSSFIISNTHSEHTCGRTETHHDHTS